MYRELILVDKEKIPTPLIGELEPHIILKMWTYEVIHFLEGLLFITLIGGLFFSMIRVWIEEHWHVCEYCSECHRKAVNAKTEHPVNPRAPRSQGEFRCPNGHKWTISEINPY